MELLSQTLTSLIALALLCHAQPTQGESHVDKLIRNFLEDLRGILKNGNPTYKIPVLDPTYLGAHLTADYKEISVAAWLEGRLSGISDYIVNKVHVDLDLNVDLSLSFQGVKFEGIYNLTGSAVSGVIPLKGKGPIYIFLQELSVSLTPGMVAEGGFLKMTSCNFTFQEEDIEVSIGGLLEDGVSDVLRPFLNDLATSLLDRLRARLQALVDGLIVNIFNFQGQGITLYNVIDTIKSFLG